LCRAHRPTSAEYILEQHHGVSGHSEYDSVNNYGFGYIQPYYTNTQWQQSRSQTHRSPGYGMYYAGYPASTPPAQPQVVTKVTVVIDTNVLLDYLMVIQKFVADVEKTRRPCVIVIPSVVVSELDWCVEPRSLVNY
jgi:hypothetical protein